MTDRTRFVKLHVVPEHVREYGPEGDVWYNIACISNISEHHEPAHWPHGTRIESYDGITIVRESVEEVLAAIAEAEGAKCHAPMPTRDQLLMIAADLRIAASDATSGAMAATWRCVGDWLERVAGER